MAVQEEPKEPYVSSVLPWIILHRIIWQEEDTFRSLCHQQQLQNPADEGVPSAGLRNRPDPLARVWACVRGP